MKKKNLISKVLVLALALVMVFTMTAAAFAANGSVSVKVFMDGEAYIDEVVTDADIASNITGSGHLYTIPVGLTQSESYTAADALIQAWYNAFGTNSHTSDQINYGWDVSEAGKEGLYFDIYDGISADAGHYYKVREYQGLDEDGNTVTYYEYYWAGNTWNLYIDGSSTPADKYASRYYTSDINSVEFVYEETRSENFSLTYEIPDAL